MPRRSVTSGSQPVPGILYRMPGELRRVPRRSDSSDSWPMPRHMALERDRAACPAQHGVAADRFAREIVGILKLSPGALAAAEHQTVSRNLPQTNLTAACARLRLRDT